MTKTLGGTCNKRKRKYEGAKCLQWEMQIKPLVLTSIYVQPNTTKHLWFEGPSEWSRVTEVPSRPTEYHLQRGQYIMLRQDVV